MLETITLSESLVSTAPEVPSASNFLFYPESDAKENQKGVRSPETGAHRDQSTANEREFHKYILADRLRIPLRGKVMGWLYVIEECKDRGQKGPIYLLVECTRCGSNKQFRVRADSVRSGRTRSCGCLRRDTLKLPPDRRIRRWSGNLDKLFGARTRFLEWVTEGRLSSVCSTPFGPCLDWTGRKSKDGYAQLSVGVQQVQASHLAWLYKYGEMPTLPVRHICDNAGCVNVDHLFLGNCSTDAYDKQMKKKGAILVEVYQGPYEVWAPSSVNESCVTVSEEGGPDAR